tara:strand:- start:246 stop:401 length:156 start_codon:yes stop_codon:yes gene_type:complete
MVDRILAAVVDRWLSRYVDLHQVAYCFFTSSEQWDKNVETKARLVSDQIAC